MATRRIPLASRSASTACLFLMLEVATAGASAPARAAGASVSEARASTRDAPLQLALRSVPANELPALPAETAPLTPATPPTQLKLELPNGSSIRFGLLWQARLEAIGASGSGDYARNLFLRRFALLIGGTVLHDLEYFFDTDFSDLFKASGPDATKSGPDIVTKDAFVTYRAVDDALKVEAGLLLPPGARNTLVGAGGLLGLDFFRNAFRHAAVFGSQNGNFGRDLGVQLRGLLGGAVEYRLGAFQGRRSAPVEGPAPRAGARNSFRVAGRVQVDLLDPETTFFYASTYLGKKTILSLGASLDYQHEDTEPYLAYAADAALDVPLGPGGVTAEVDLVRRDGGARVALPAQTAFEAEAGYRIDALKLSPVLRYERRWMESGAGDETDLGAALAFWAYGHTSNLKLAYDRIGASAAAPVYHQFNLQWQLAFY
jgi:hypothetical protein